MKDVCWCDLTIGEKIVIIIIMSFIIIAAAGISFQLVNMGLKRLLERIWYGG